MRRILVDYFHYEVTYVMNITDVDDKVRGGGDGGEEVSEVVGELRGVES